MKILDEKALEKFEQLKSKITGKPIKRNLSNEPLFRFKFSFSSAALLSMSLGLGYHFYRKFDKSRSELSQRINFIKINRNLGKHALLSDLFNKITHFKERNEPSNLHFANHEYQRLLLEYLEGWEQEMKTKQIVLTQNQSSCKYNLWLIKLHCSDMEHILLPNGNIIKRTYKCKLKIDGVRYFQRMYESRNTKKDSKKNIKKKKRQEEKIVINFSQLLKKININTSTHCSTVNFLNSFLSKPENSKENQEKQSIETASEGKIKKDNKNIVKEEVKEMEHMHQPSERNTFLMKECRQYAKEWNEEFITKIKEVIRFKNEKQAVVVHNE